MRKFKKFTVVFVPAMLAVSACALCASAQTIEPTFSFSMEDAFADGSYHVGFEMDDVTDKEIFAQMYSELYYDIVSIGQMKVGDTIETPDGDLEIKSIDQAENEISINSGEYTLVNPEDTNGWYARDYELPVYELLGEAQLLLADEITLNTYKMKEDGSPNGRGYDTVECAPGELKENLEKLPFSDNGFYPSRVTVDLKDEKIEAVTIIYTP